MSWIALATPALSVLALVVAIASGVASWRALRAVRILDDALGSAPDDTWTGSPAVGTVDDTVATVWSPTSRGIPSATHAAPAMHTARRDLRRAPIMAGGAALVALIGVAAWMAWPQGTDARAGVAPVDPATQVPADITPVAAPGSVRVIVLNGSGIEGAAGDVVQPRVARGGWQMLEAANAPTNDLARSQVHYTRDHRDAAMQIAKDLGLARAVPIDGVDPQGADVVVVVGRDLARG